MIPPSTLYPGKPRAIAFMMPWLFRWAMSPAKRKWAATNYRKYADGPHLKPRVRIQDRPKVVEIGDWHIRVN